MHPHTPRYEQARHTDAKRILSQSWQMLDDDYIVALHEIEIIERALDLCSGMVECYVGNSVLSRIQINVV